MIIHYKIYFILLFQIGFGQLFLNRFIGEDIFINSARSSGMGGTYSLSANSSGLTLKNPAGMLRLNSGRYGDLNFGIFSSLERRSILVKDFFGDYLTLGDYVANNNSFMYCQGGIIKRNDYKNFKTSLSLLFSQSTSFNYLYQEEVRSEQSFEDGEFGNKDPLAGFLTLETSGELELYSFGFSMGTKSDLEFNIGIGLHIPFPSSFSDRIAIDSLYTTENLTYLSDIDPYSKSFLLPNKFDMNNSFFTFSIDMDLTDNARLFTAYENILRLYSDSTVLYLGDKNIGLPILTSYEASYDLDSNIVSDSVVFIQNGINYVKPEKYRFGIEYIPKTKIPTILVFEWEQLNYSQVSFSNISAIKTNSFHIGFGIKPYHTLPIRCGLIYKEMPFKALAPISIFTFGTGKQFGRTIVDIAANYSLYEYKYPDLFPVNGEIRSEFDTVNESKFKLFLTVRHHW